MAARVIEAQDRLEFGPSLGKRPEVHCRDASQAVTGKANYRVRHALACALSLVSQLTHHGIIAADEVIHELAAQRRDKRFRLAKPLAEKARMGISGARLRRRVAVDGDQRRTDGDLKCEFPPVPLGAFRERS
jgi:hypothetical protein